MLPVEQVHVWPFVHDRQAGLKALFDFELKSVGVWLQNNGFVKCLTKSKLDNDLIVAGRNNSRVIVAGKVL
jgi:hypothetical protein